MTDILPCPWCGSTHILGDYEFSDAPAHWIYCLTCKNYVVAPRGGAIAVWNFLYHRMEQERKEETKNNAN